MIFRSHILMNKKKKFPETNYVYLSLSGLECLKLWKHVFYISKEKCSNEFGLDISHSTTHKTL